jgi:murein DD-endopeptidase MepM/ murein hydrolase activator NlpD
MSPGAEALTLCLGPPADRCSARYMIKDTMKKLLWLLVALGVVAGAAYVLAGRAAGPAIDIVKPAAVVGTRGDLEVAIDSPGGTLTGLDVVLVQNDREVPLFTLGGAAATASLQQETGERMRLTRGIGKRDLPELTAGPARIVVRAARPVLFGWRTVRSEATRDFEVRLEPPRVAVLSTKHYVNLGGAEFVVYRVTPPGATSGVRVGEVTYPGFPASGAHLGGISLADPSIRVAFFALLYDQDLNVPISVYAEDEAGNTSSVPLDYRAFPKPLRRSRIELTDAFINRVVPPIIAQVPDLGSTDDMLAAFLAVNGELRRRNAETIAALASKTAPEILWDGAFEQLANTKVEAGFADHRTYIYKGKEVDQQVHLGFDLASTAHAPVLAGNAGVVVYADALGIYGNAVVIDHGMGVQSLYGHLSSIEVKTGDHVTKDQEIGRSGQTGLAGGDHLHFTMLVNGHMVSPVEWWDPHWIEDRIVRKLREASSGT